MSPVTEVQRLSKTSKTAPKLLSVEISYSQGKRFGEGDRYAMCVQSCWTNQIERLARGQGTQESPQVEHDSVLTWFGASAALSDHQTLAGKDKSELALFLLYPLLRPDDNGTIRLVTSHHSSFEPEIQKRYQSLLGRHVFTRNGVEVDVTIDSVELVPEGQGAFFLAKHQEVLNPGYSLVNEVGFLTTEIWLVDENGTPRRGEPIEFGVSNLASAIAEDPTVRRLILGSDSTPKQISPMQVSLALKQDRIAKIDADTWQEIKQRHLANWKDDLIGRIFDRAGDLTNQTEQFLFSGGGSALIRDELVGCGFWVDEDPATASVRGSYYRALQKV